MATHGCILMQTSEGWQLASSSATDQLWTSVDGGPAATPAAITDAVDSFVRQNDLPRRVALSLAANSTLAAPFSVDDPTELRDRRRLGYRLEDLIPIAAEDFVADFLIDGSNVLGVATATNEWLSLVTALEERDLSIQSISPAAIHAMQALFELEQNEKLVPKNCDLVAWQHGQVVELFQVGNPLNGWTHLPAEPAALLQQVGAQLVRQSGKLRLLLLDFEGELLQCLENLGELELQTAESVPLTEQARRGAATVLAGKWKPWIELRREGLTAGDPHRAVRGAANLCLAAAAIFLFALAGFFWTRSAQYERQAASSQQKQEQLFQRAFPNTPIPAAINSRLKSEQRKLRGARGDEAAVRLPPSALNVLYELAAGLPDDVRLQAEQIRIENGQVDLDVNVQSVGVAGQLAEALQEQHFDIEPPTTEQRDAKTVAARIHGALQKGDRN